MKLCRDCRHFARIGEDAGWCKHPKADFNVVDGSPLTYCFQARGEITRSEKTICGMDAKLFEERPAPIELKPGDPVCLGAVYGKPGFLQRIFGRWL